MTTIKIIGTKEKNQKTTIFIGKKTNVLQLTTSCIFYDYSCITNDYMVADKMDLQIKKTLKLPIKIRKMEACVRCAATT